jgi:small subunit ribosomal protein S16
MVKIRLFRTGTHKQPHYRIVAIDERRKRQGRVLETLGTYAPLGTGSARLNQPAIDRWLERGAQASPTVASLIRRTRLAAAEAPAEAATAE